LHNEELLNLYSSPNIIRAIKTRRMRWVGQLTRMRVMINACKIVVRKCEKCGGKKPLGRGSHGGRVE